jgi:histone deacetylase 1/2
MVCEYWEAHRNKRMDYDSSPFDPTKKFATSLQVKGGKKCEFCSKHRKRISKSHNTESCFFGDTPGWSKTKTANIAQNQINSHNGDDSNKPESSSYPVCLNVSTPIFYDTGCTPTSYFKDKPANLMHFNGTVKTATNSTAEAKGRGSITIGKLHLDNIVWVPSFQYNLLSGIQLMGLGYKQVIKDNILKISKGNEVLCTGTFNPSYGLIEMNANLASKAKVLTLTEWHNRLSHISQNFLTRNLKLNKIEFIDEDIHCSSCIQGKMKRTFKSKPSDVSYEPLDMIEADTTSFPLSSHDGYHANVKFVDRCTGYIYSGWLQNLKSSTVLEHFRIFKQVIENQTKFKIKVVRTDGGTEFTSSFENFLLSQGIIKQTTQPYRKHLPARAERAHQTILNLGKAAHIASKLPIEYFSDAHRYSVYVYNRMIREGKTNSPYEALFNIKVDITQIFPFGSVCFAHVPLQNRKEYKKLDDTSVRCRFLGFGSDDISYHRHGYKLLREHDLKIFYSSDVIICPELEMIPLTGKLTTNDYEKLWLPLVQKITQITEGERNYEDDDEEEDVVVTRSSPDDRIEEAISIGHIETARGSVIPSEFALLSVFTNLPISYLSHPEFYATFSAAMTFGCPNSYEEAMSSKESTKWKAAMDDEINSIKTAQTWEVRKPRMLNKDPVKCRWVYTKKFNKDGSVSRYKARLVAKGYTQRYGHDYFETFSPVLKFTSLRVLIALAAHFKLNIYQDDVPTAFLKGVLKEEIWMEQPPGFKEGSDGDLCYLSKTLYGLKQSPREWNSVIHEHLLSRGFKQSQADPCIYTCQSPLLFVGVYVDDISTVGTEENTSIFRNNLRKEFSITQGGPLEWYLGISIQKLLDGSIALDQTLYLQQKLEEFKEFIPPGGISHPLPQNYQKLLQDAEKEELYVGTFPYRKVVGSIMYAMLGTRPDLACAVSIVSQFLDKHKPTHVKLVQRILHYIRANLELKLVYGSTNKSFTLSGYCDASYANEIDYYSRSGYGFMLGDSLISWYSKKQPVIAQSAAEAEYYAASVASNEAVWLQKLLKELGFDQKTVTLYEDNQACIALTKNPEDHKRTKHIQVKFHVIRYYVSKGFIKLVYCNTKEQLADMFTKGVSGTSLRTLLKGFNISRI